MTTPPPPAPAGPTAGSPPDATSVPTTGPTGASAGTPRWGVELPMPAPRSHHPVRRFVILCAAVLIVLIGIRVSGAVNPWVEVRSAVGGSGSITSENGDPAAVRTFLEVELENKGMTTLEVTGATLTTDDEADPVTAVFLRDSTAATGYAWSISAPDDDHPVGVPGLGLRPFRPTHIGPGETRMVMVFHLTTCTGPVGTLHLEVESLLGRSRTLDLPLDPSSC